MARPDRAARRQWPQWPEHVHHGGGHTRARTRLCTLPNPLSTTQGLAGACATHQSAGRDLQRARKSRSCMSVCRTGAVSYTHLTLPTICSV
eukprot:747422-Prymnesium_polylepis.1